MMILVEVSPVPKRIHAHRPSPVWSLPLLLMTSHILPMPAMPVPPAWSFCIRSVLLCAATPFVALPGARRARNWLLVSTMVQLHWLSQPAIISIFRCVMR